MQKYKILVAEDDKAIRDSIGIYLTNSNYDVVYAENGKEAIEKFQSEKIDLVIMDLMMPEMSGEEAIIKLREKSFVPIIILSAKSEDYDKVIGLNIGADDYIVKPFNPLELMARVNSNIRRLYQYQSSGENSESIEIGGIKLNTMEKNVYVDGEKVSLTSLEYKILELLMENPNRVFSIDEIYERVWNEPAIEPKTVTVHIRRIREKIEFDPKKPLYLKVAWGLGYKFVNPKREELKMDKDIYEDGNLKDELPREKFSFRYTTKGIWLFIIIISMISILGTFFMKSFGTDFYGRVSKEEFYSHEFRNEIMNMDSRNEYNYNNVNLLDFYIRSYGMSNYEFTREFKEKYPNIVAVRNNISGEIVRTFNVDELDYYRDDYTNGSYSFNIDVTEEPNYVLKNKSNLNYGDNVNPQDIKIKSNEIAVKGIYENGKVTFNNANVNENVKEESNNKIFETALKNATIDYFYYDNNDGNEYLNYVQQNNDKVNFCFILDLNSNVITNLENNYYTQEMLIPSIVTIFMLSMFMVAIFGTVTNYKKARRIEFYEGISKFPIEIVWVLWLLLLAGVGLFTNEFRISPDITGTVIIGVGQFIFTFFSSIALVYLIFGIKSIYNEGMKSFLIEKSITVKVCKWFVNLFKRFYHKVKNYFVKILDNLEILNKRHITILFISLIIGGGIVISITTYNSTFLIILWIIFITVAFNYAKKYYEDLINISETSKLISKGNYDIKINENTTNFKDIAHSFNTIGDNLNEAVDKAIKSERLKSELITNVSHDLKTPLTSIINYSELIVDEKSDFEKQKEYAKVINEKSLKLKKLIEDLFEVSKVTSNNIELHIEEIDFKQLVNQIVGEWLDKFEEKKLDINISITDKPVSLQLDGNKTSRVLDNLFSNIYKYTLEGTRVYIDLDKNNTTTLTIKNISKYALNISADELMERFTRGDSSRTTEGSGLGLSIASSLVDAQGGSFEIEIDGDLFKTIIEF